MADDQTLSSMTHLGPVRPLSEADLDNELVWRLVEAAPDALVICDRSGRILLVNGQLEAMFGYERSELLGKPVEELVPVELRGRHRAHRTRYEAEPRVREMGGGLELHGRRRDGEAFPIEISLSPIERSGEHDRWVMAAIRDVSARIDRERQLHETQQMLDIAHDAAFIFDADDLHFTWVNQGAVDQLGYGRDELLTMTPLHICPDFTEREYRLLVEPLLGGAQTSLSYVTTHRRRSGDDIPVEVSIQSATVDEGRARRCVAVARDLTDRIEGEQRLREAERRLGMLEDRERIARDLHDKVVQRVFAVGLGLQALAARVDTPDLVSRIEAMQSDLDDTISDIRTTIFQLQSHTAVGEGVRGEIFRIIEAEQVALGFEPRIVMYGPIETLDTAVAGELCSVLREALSNVARHAGATTAEVRLAVGDDAVLEVIDNGRGIPDGYTPGNGLENMATRAGRLGGSCTWATNDPTGTVARWAVPLTVPGP